MIYKIMCEMKKKGIERILPYEIDNWEDASAISETLDAMLSRWGYTHRVEEGTPTPVKYERQGGKSVR